MRTKFLLMASLAVNVSGAYAATTPAEAPSLEDQLKVLELPANQAPAAVSTEKLYSVQSRYNPLGGRFEMATHAAQDFSNSSFLSSQQLGASLRYHFNDRWSLGVSGGQVFNRFTETANLLMQQEGILPDIAYAKYRADMQLAVNTLYGKFRISQDSVLYLDQYLALGGGISGMDRGNTPMATLDVGFAFWLGRSGVVRVGFKDHFYRETRALSSVLTHHWLGHVDLGWIFGGRDSGGVQ